MTQEENGKSTIFFTNVLLRNLKENTIVTRKVYKYNSESSSKDSLKNPHL